MLAAARRLVGRSPRSVRLGKLGRDRARGKWLMLSVLFLGTAVIYGAWVGGQSERLLATLTGGIEQLAVAAGFGVKRIAIEGRRHTTNAEIAAALGAGPDTMMLGFDTDDAKERLEAVAWIRHAQVTRFLPSTLQVVIEERVPYAIWQNKGRTYVVDAEGIVLAPALREAYADLPFVVGEGAGKHAKALYAELEDYGDVERKMLAALRVGDRRWTLKLTSGLEVMLPDDNIAEALKSLTELDEDRGVFERDIAAIDLRLHDRISVRLREAEAAKPANPPATADVPTASTEPAPADGRT